MDATATNHTTPLNISVLIPCRNEAAYIKKAVDSILNQHYRLGQIEVLVIDGMSDDGTRAILQSIVQADKRVNMVDNPAQTTPQAMNIGLNTAQYKYILRIDAHAVALPGFLTKNMNALLTDEKVMCAGGKIININENKISERIGYAMSSPFGVGNATFRIGGERKYVDTLAFGIYDKKVFEIIGEFDETLVRNQDDELNFRLTKEGFKILYDPEIQSEYFVRGSIKKLYKQYYQYGYWKVYVNKKHRTVTTLRQLIPFIFVLGLFTGALLSLFVPYFWMLFSVGLLFYAFLALYFGFKSSRSFNAFISTALIFPVLHFSYGMGYLTGIVHFLLFNKKPSNRSKSLSRQ